MIVSCELIGWLSREEVRRDFCFRDFSQTDPTIDQNQRGAEFSNHTYFSDGTMTRILV